MTLMLALKEAEKWNGRRATRVVIAGSLVSSIGLASVGLTSSRDQGVLILEAHLCDR